TLNVARNKCICVEFLNNSAALCLFGTADMSNFDNELEFRFKPDTTWANADEEDRTAVRRLWSWIQSCKGNPAKFLREYKDYFGNEAPFAWYALTNYFMAVDNRAKNMMFVTWDGLIWYIIPYDMDTLFGERNDSYLKFDYKIDFDTIDESQGAYCFAGHDSVLWELVRGCPDKLAEVARTIRANMSTEYVLDVFNNQFMGEWCERIYNKDGEYKYIAPLLEQGRDYLYALQGSRYAHRTYTIVNRFNLLDSEYCAGTYRDDAFPVYFSYNFAANPRSLKITAAERFCFGYGMTNGDPTASGPDYRADGPGDEITLTFRQNLIINDPQNIYGASRIQGLNLSDVSHAIVGTLNLNKCLRLRNLDASCSDGQTQLTAMILEGCRNLRTLDVNGLNGLTSLNLAQNKKLETLDAVNTKLTNVIFAQGGTLSEAKLPATIQTLELRYLQNLAPSALTFSGTPAVTRLVVDNCRLIDWEALLARCPSTTYLRVTGINTSGRGELLRKFLTMKGVDENGNNVNTCRLVGTYQLTKYLEESEYNELTAHFPELNIKQPEWTVIKYDETVSDGKNISNLDNETGYDYDNEFEPSAHVAAILAKRHRVMAKYTAEGEMTVCPLDDTDGRRYHDGSEANL
ncbi:MAG: CotH kinase family protein, partial [Muribaculaceae bacterium]|nr:CotH kinase family protein [Muribaculaceae bacterium]